MDEPQSRKAAATTDYYGEFLAERDEILRHKYFASERAGHDVGFERALTEWTREHRPVWRAQRDREAGRA